MMQVQIKNGPTCTTRWGTYAEGRPALELLCPGEQDLPDCWAVASVNPLGWPQSLDMAKHIAIKDWSENDGMVEDLAGAGVIKPQVCFTQPSGFVVIKFFELTEAAIADRMAQFEKEVEEEEKEEDEDEEEDFEYDDEDPDDDE